MEDAFRYVLQPNQQNTSKLLGTTSPSFEQYSQQLQEQLNQIVELQGQRSQQSIQGFLQAAGNVSQQPYSSNPVQHKPSQLTYPNQSFSHQSSNTPATNGKPLSTSAYSAAPPPPPGPTLQAPPPSKNALFPAEALLHLPTRPVSARARLGKNAVLEARKGLSRVIDATSFQDIHLFGEQLRHNDQRAVEIDWSQEDNLPIFAVSYVQMYPSTGRFKFNTEQWECFVRIIGQLVECGVAKFRVWLDQCLWLRDASQGGWAHTGLLPYIIWPVISLGMKRVGAETSVESRKRMWPFLEEISGLWGMGVMFAREMRAANAKGGCRKWMSYSHRARLEPELGMELLLHNIFHGAADHLETGWQEDVKELKEMARANVLLNGTELYIGSDWKQRISLTRASLKTMAGVINAITLPVASRSNGGVNLYLEGSRVVMCGSWNGISEWLSGDRAFDNTAADYYTQRFASPTQKVQVLCDEGEFALLKVGHHMALWLLVAMNGFTSNFSRGKVAWTKVVTGVESCQLAGDLLFGSTNINALAVEHVLEKQLGRRAKVKTITNMFSNIEWE